MDVLTTSSNVVLDGALTKSRVSCVRRVGVGVRLEIIEMR